MSRRSCEQFEEHLSAFLDEELDEKLHAQIARHIEKCPKCRQALVELRQVVSWVHDLPRGTAPADLSETLVARLEREQLYGGLDALPAQPSIPPGALRFGRLVASAAVVLLTVTAGYLTIDYVRQSRRSEIRLADAERSSAVSASDETNRAGKDSKKAAMEMSEEIAQTAKPSAAPRKEMASAPPAAPLATPAGTTAVRTKAMKTGAPTQAAPTPTIVARVAKPSSLPIVAEASATSRPAPTESRMLLPPPAQMAAGRSAASFPSTQRSGGLRDMLAKASTVLFPPAEPSPMAERGGRASSPNGASEWSYGGYGGAPSGGIAARQTVLTDRLAEGVTVEELERHAMDQEPVQLVLSANNAAEREQVARELRSFFARNAIVDARSLGAKAAVDPASNFYMLQAVPSSQASTEQFLFRGTPTQVSTLVDEIAQSRRSNVQVVLNTPALQADGWERANQVARMLREPPSQAVRGRVESSRTRGEGSPTTERASYLAKGAPSDAVSQDVQRRREAEIRSRWIGAAKQADKGHGMMAREVSEPIGPPPLPSPQSAPTSQSIRQAQVPMSQGLRVAQAPGVSQLRLPRRDGAPAQAPDRLVTVVITVQAQK